jgi:hypothetical protein
MGERSLLLRALLEHRDRRPNALINENHESFFLVAKKNRAAAARRSHAADLHFDNGLTHTSLAFPPRSELLSTGDQELNPSSKINSLEFQVTVQRACVFARRTHTLEIVTGV